MCAVADVLDLPFCRLFLIGEATFCGKTEENVNPFTFFLFVERFSLNVLDILEFRMCTPVCV